jgi:lipopolysaccharide export system protein LptA
MGPRSGVKTWLTAAAFTSIGLLAQAQPPAPAQQPPGPANALQGFAQNRDQPVQIDARQLEVRDKEKKATFSGNVKVVQGDTTMRAQTLDVFYDGDGSTTNALTSAQPGPGGQQRIKRLDVKGGVKVCQNDQIVTGNEGTFDMQANTVTLQGNVVLTKEQNVLKGDRLVVDLTTGAAKIDGGKSGGVSALLIPSSIQEEKKKQEQPQKQPQAAHKQQPCT